jgi:hypothetical protein
VIKIPPVSTTCPSAFLSVVIASLICADLFLLFFLFDVTAKSLVFSQYTSTLKWLQEELPKHGFQFRTLSGDMSMKKRAKALHDFQSDPPTTIFLLSMRYVRFCPSCWVLSLCTTYHTISFSIERGLWVST